MKQEGSRKSRVAVILVLICVGGLCATISYLFLSQKAQIEEVKKEGLRAGKSVGDKIRDNKSELSPTDYRTSINSKPPKQKSLPPNADLQDIKEVEKPRATIEKLSREPAQIAPTPLASPASTSPVPPEAKEPVAVPAEPKVDKSQKITTEDRKTFEPEFWFWGGVGENYQYYKQSVPSNAGSADFQNIKGPTLYLSGGLQGKNFGAEFVHKESPGKMSAPVGATIKGGDYVWTILSAEGLYRMDDSQWRFRFGLQYHSMPFMVYTPATANLDIKLNTLVMATVGFDRTYMISKKMRGEWQLRYQHPITSGTSSGDTFKVSPVLAFDGSIGASYHLGEHFRGGLYWYGQYHTYKFDYSGVSKFSGDQTLFYSNAELRFGFEF